MLSREQKKRARRWQFNHSLTLSGHRYRTQLTPLIGEDGLELLHDLFLRMSLGDGQFLDQQATRRIEHLALAERQFLDRKSVV